jgi:hypothetical protein
VDLAAEEASVVAVVLEAASVEAALEVVVPLGVGRYSPWIFSKISSYFLHFTLKKPHPSIQTGHSSIPQLPILNFNYLAFSYILSVNTIPLHHVSILQITTYRTARFGSSL